MLRKLFKYEFKATSRVFLPMYGIFLVLMVLARFFYLGQNEALFGNSILSGLSVFLVTLIVIAAFTAVWVVTLVLTIRRFWQNLLGREGYLSHVLPVESWEHVLTKLVTGVVWTICSTIVTVGGLWIMLDHFIRVNGVMGRILAKGVAQCRNIHRLRLRRKVRIRERRASVSDEAEHHRDPDDVKRDNNRCEAHETR